MKLVHNCLVSLKGPIMKKLALLTAGIIASINVAQASELTIDIGNNAFRTEFVSTELGKGSEMSLAVLATDNDINVYSAKGLVTGNVENIRGLDASLGVKGYYLDIPGEDEYGFGLGGEVSFKLPANPRAQIETHFYYSPGITVSGDVDYITDISIRGSYKLLKNGEVYVGYRNLSAEMKDAGNLELNKGLNVGFKFLF